MRDDSLQPTLLFPDGEDSRHVSEGPSRGYLGGLVVRDHSGREFEMFFIERWRLMNELDGTDAAGKAFFAEPNLVVVRACTPPVLREAVEGLWREGYFDTVGPKTDGR